MSHFALQKLMNLSLESVVTWIRQGELESKTLDCEIWNPHKLYKVLPQIRKLTFVKDQEKIFIPKLQFLLAECGVAVAIVKHQVAAK